MVEPVQKEKILTLPGNTHPMARAGNDRGELADQQAVTRMQLLLQRGAAQESALQQLMAQQLDPGSPKYHAWLTPQEFGEQFGPAESDLQAVKNWLTSEGFTGLKVNNGRTMIEFRGTAGMVRNAFHTPIHRLSVNGEDRFANMDDPKIPAALMPVVSGVLGLNNFRKKPMIHRLGKFRRDGSTGQITPLFTFNDVNGTFYGMGPADFAKIYNIPLAANGSGQSIAIVGRTNINIQDVRDFRTVFGLPANDPQIVLNGPDPGLVSGDEGESDLDVEWSGAVAPKAKIILVATQATQTDGVDGVDASAIYIVDNNLAPIMSESYGSCEANLGASGNAFFNSLWQQAAAEGITVLVSSGDNGSAGCDDPNSESSATAGIAVSGIASTPYNVSMGGTDFDQAGIQTTFWNPTNAAGSQLSAMGYIPEITWNDSCANAGLTGCNSVTSSSPSLNIVAGSGGPSKVYTKTQAPWQTGFGDTARDTPDVSLFASDGQNGSFYIVCESDENIVGDTGCDLSKFTPTSPFHDFQAVGGTSASAPAFAGIMALVNQKTGHRQGNANITLYALAKGETFSSCNSSDKTSGSSSNTTCIFNDITKGTVSVPCAGAALNCSKTSSGGFGVLAASSTVVAYGTATGYDLATGLGSVNVANLLNMWSTPTLLSTTTTLTSSPSTISGPVGTSFLFSGKVTKSSGTATPTGAVVFENTTTSFPADSATLDGSGNYSVNTAFLPAGAYSIKAHYGGDSKYAASDSAALSVNLAKQNSTVVVSFVNSSGALSTASQTVAYGSPYILRVDVTNAAGTACQNAASGAVAFVCPSGSVNLTDNGSALADFPNAQTPNASATAKLNDRGFAEDQPIQLNAGAHAIKASYTADTASSYNSQSASNTLAVTVTQAMTTTTVIAGALSVTAGGNITLNATVSSQSNSSVGPSGTVQFLSGGANLGAAAPCTPTGASSSTGASCKATLMTTLSALPPGLFVPRPPNTPFVVVALLSFILAVLSFGLAMMLVSRRKHYAYAGLALLLVSAAAIAGCGGGGSSTGGGGGGSSRSITAKYSGDTNYATSTSTAVTVTVN